MRKILFLLAAMILIIALAAPVLAGGFGRNDRNDRGHFDRHNGQQYRYNDRGHFDWRIFIPRIIIGPMYPQYPQPERYWVPGYWDTRLEYDPYTGRYYQQRVWIPGHYEYR